MLLLLPLPPSKTTEISESAAPQLFADGPQFQYRRRQRQAAFVLTQYRSKENKTTILVGDLNRGQALKSNRGEE